MLKVHAKRLNAVEVLSLEGLLVTGNTEILRTAMQLASGVSEIILDMANVSVVDAHGLGVLLQLREQALAKGAHFELVNVNSSLYRVFEITRLDTVFNVNRSIGFVPRFAFAKQMPVAA
jgi:stage II sporulation protein AA (anti-sigma F factor antagonist)